MTADLTVLVPIKDYGDDAEFNARAAIEVLIYTLWDKKLADADAISDALLWWSEEVYEVIGFGPETEETK